MGCGASNSPEINPLTPTPPFLEGMRSLPLTAAPPFRYGSPVTLAQLNHRRQEFWATRTDGNAMMWQAIRTAAEAMLSGDIGLANAILEASNIITPNGSIDVCYDERGHQYKAPLFCYANPIELTDERAMAATVAKQWSSKTIKVIEPAPLSVKVRVNPGDFNMLIGASTTNTVAEFKKMVQDKSIERQVEKQQTSESSPLCDENLQRIIFMGRELQNTQILGEVGLDESRVVQVFLRQPKAQ